MNLVYDVCLSLGQQQLQLFTTALGASTRIWNAASTRAMKNAVELARHAPIGALEAPAPANFDALAAIQKKYFAAVELAILWPGMADRPAANAMEGDRNIPRAPAARATRKTLARL
jgi:hypothetical protein